jgi:hypothetical protein
LPNYIEEISRYLPDISNRLLPLVQHPSTFDVDEIPTIAQAEILEMLNDTQIDTRFCTFSEEQFGTCGLLNYPALQKLFEMFFYHSSTCEWKQDIQLRFTIE